MERREPVAAARRIAVEAAEESIVLFYQMNGMNLILNMCE
jgi:hypothetical protein